MSTGVLGLHGARPLVNRIKALSLREIPSQGVQIRLCFEETEIKKRLSGTLVDSLILVIMGRATGQPEFGDIGKRVHRRTEEGKCLGRAARTAQTQNAHCKRRNGEEHVGRIPPKRPAAYLSSLCNQ